MRRIPKLRRVGLGVGLVLAALPWLAACGNEEEAALERQAEQTRAIMHEIFEALQVALPVSADLDRFRAAESRAEIAAALDSLAANTGVLESHTGYRDPRMRQLARSVARDARATQRAFREGQYDRSAFLLLSLSLRRAWSTPPPDTPPTWSGARPGATTGAGEPRSSTREP